MRPRAFTAFLSVELPAPPPVLDEAAAPELPMFPIGRFFFSSSMLVIGEAKSSSRCFCWPKYVEARCWKTSLTMMLSLEQTRINGTPNSVARLSASCSLTYASSIKSILVWIRTVVISSPHSLWTASRHFRTASKLSQLFVAKASTHAEAPR